MEELGPAAVEVRASPAELAERCELVLTCLPSVRALEDVISGRDGLARSASRAPLVVDLSSLPLEGKERQREVLMDRGADLLDCPVSGTPEMAERRSIAIFASGDRRAFERVEPLLRRLAPRTRYLGGFGVGSRMKQVANLLVVVHTAAAAEAVRLAQAVDLDPELVTEVIGKSAAASAIFELRGRRMFDGTFTPAWGSIDALRAEIVTISEAARGLGLETPLLAGARALFDRAAEAGHGESDTSAVVAVLRTERSR